MASNPGFYKGEKKKPKKDKLGSLARKVETNTSWSSAPTFTLPKIAPKGKGKNE